MFIIRSIYSNNRTRTINCVIEGSDGLNSAFAEFSITPDGISVEQAYRTRMFAENTPEYVKGFINSLFEQKGALRVKKNDRIGFDRETLKQFVKHGEWAFNCNPLTCAFSEPFEKMVDEYDKNDPRHDAMLNIAELVADRSYGSNRNSICELVVKDMPGIARAAKDVVELAVRLDSIGNSKMRLAKFVVLMYKNHSVASDMVSVLDSPSRAFSICDNSRVDSAFSNLIETIISLNLNDFERSCVCSWLCSQDAVSWNVSNINDRWFISHVDTIWRVGKVASDLKAAGVPFTKSFSKMMRLSIAEQQTKDARMHEEFSKKRNAVIKMLENAGITVVARMETAEEYNAEGKFMHHCVGSYWSKFAKGESMCLGVVVPWTKERVTVEFEMATGRVNQCYKAHDDRPLSITVESIKNAVKDVKDLWKTLNLDI